MWNKFKNWWNRDKLRADQAMAELKRYSEALTEAREEAAVIKQQQQVLEQQRAELINETVTLESELEVFRTKAAEDAARRNSTEPWVEIKSERIDPIKGLQLELDWNEAFIQHLKESGLQGRDEDTIVQKWLALLTHKLVEGLEQQSINKTEERGTKNDFL